MEPSILGEGITQGSAAVFNIVCALGCVATFRRLQSRPNLRLFVFFFGAYSLFSGFGYLMVDPLLASPDSPGDWAKIVMLLGGGWGVRVPIIIVGAVGTIWGFFWMGRAAQHFVWGDPLDRKQRNRMGLTLCILPYVAVSSVLSPLVIWHPMGSLGAIPTLLKLWPGFIGFFWAFMIVFVFVEYRGKPDLQSPLPHRVSRQAIAALMGMTIVTPLLLRTVLI